MSTKRVILADGSRLLREMLHRVIERADQLEVVQDLPSDEGLSSAIERLGPHWVILSLPYNESAHSWIKNYIADFPSLQFIFLSPESNTVKVKWQPPHEEDLTSLTLSDIIQILEKDLQHT